MLNETKQSKQTKQTDVEELVRREIDAVLLNDDGSIEYTMDDPLLTTGLNSLMLAQLLLQLESALGVDPFGDERSIADVHTIRDLVSACEAAIAATSAGV
jgi:acyl carrier protein